jgi:nanoRNase/pAp phosphatase (c-di-AMP/oligoRNAs hydrolase)
MVASSIAKGFGAGGGHDMMAGGRVILKKSNQDRVDEIIGILEERFVEAVRMIKHKPGRPLLAEFIEEENR